MKIFNETQKFTQWWLHLINFGLLGLLFFFIYKWFILKEAAGNVSETDSTSQTIVIMMFLFSILVFLLIMYLFRLKTTIDETGIHYQFYPFHFSKKTVRWNEMEKCYVRTYSPMKEYGGWGYRSSFGKKKGSAFNVKGNLGIQLELKTGKKLLIGTQKEEDARQVIQRHFKKGDE